MAPKSQVPTHTVPSQLVWQLVKNYNCFLHKGLNGSQFSAERGNLYNVNSYKYSGQCPAEGSSIQLTTHGLA